MVALLGVLLLGGSAVTMAVRNRPRPAAAQVGASALAITPAVAEPTTPAPSHAFERLPDDIQKDLLEIEDMLRDMAEGA